MTTAYTPILQLALPQTGELSGTWGTVVNDNITLMVEQAVAGLATISTWTANAHTLTTADGTTSEARCAMLVATNGAGGTALSGAGEIICPAATKLYVLRNNSSYAITLKVAASTGVAVPAGQTAFLFCDSAEVYACVTTIVDATISGNLTVNGNTTLGDAATDTITATGQFNTDLLPSTDNARDLGSTAKSWRTLYCDTSVLVGNLSLSGNTLSSTDSNGNIVIAPNGAGDVQLDADTVRVGDSAAAVTLTSNGAGALTVTTGGAANLVLSTNSGTTSGSITVTQGAGADLVLAPNGAGSVALPKLKVTGSSSGSVIIQAAAAAGSATYTLPSADGTNGQVLSTNGSGVLSWATAGAGTVTSVTGTSPVASSGGTTPAISLSANYGDTLNPYNSKTANYVLAAPNGSAGVPTFRALVAADVPTLNQNTTGTASNVTGTVAIANGGSGQTTANAAFNALAPSQTSNSGKYLTTNGTNTSWATVSAGTPAGSNTQVQYNNVGAFGASSAFTWSSNTLKVTSDGLEISSRGGNNVAVGQSALTGAFLTGNLNTALGTATLSANATAENNTAVGYSAGTSLTTGGRNTFIGAYAGVYAETTADNTAIGYHAYENGKASSNVAIGSLALESAAPSTYGTGSGNVAIGHHAGQVVTSAANNVLIGYDSGVALTTGNNNTFVGYQTASTFLSGNNNTVIGNGAAPTTTSVSNEITLGNSSIATLRCQVTSITALSDARDKNNVQDIPLGVSFIQRLHPVSFVWNTRDTAKVDIPEFGFIAQELQQAQRDHGVTLPGLVYDINPERLEAAPGTLIPVLVKAVQELQAQIDDLKRQLAARG